ncbi:MULTISPECIES: carbohydrate ABC transporter permease [Paenibacillus]|uniref:Carbohydrate ABC transporter permease n=1 Tax=Paenibacillus baimaensis TaxID=2982185 RepID=A0ABT2UMV8_9BACL|nr:carbohydrate ABC transporter permease [Paenibacillus sp. WQ 127069]MCU6795990.1 carbohydrate ABC transporter permease [Paenibacillus sp. WQ 127069]
MKNTGLANRLFDISNFTVLMLLSLSIVLPFVYMLSISLSNPVQVGLYQVGLIPRGFNWKSYETVFQDNQILLSYWNSVRYTMLGTVLVLLIGCLTAYPLSVNRFKARRPLSILFTFTMFFSGGLIPSFMLLKNLSLLDTIWAITLPAAFSFWNIVILRTNFQAMPQELYESAFIDGANDWQILFRIVLPLSKAILATIALFASVGLWNAYFGPLMYLTSPEMQPLTIILRRILLANEVLSQGALDQANSMEIDPVASAGRMMSIRMATIFVTIGPIVLIYPFVQKYFVQGVLVGSVKG